MPQKNTTTKQQQQKKNIPISILTLYWKTDFLVKEKVPPQLLITES